jgi:hypothetical protein
VVETIRLESGHTLTGIGGSNPSLSAIVFVINKLYNGDTCADTELNREVCHAEYAIPRS